MAAEMGKYSKMFGPFPPHLDEIKWNLNISFIFMHSPMFFIIHVSVILLYIFKNNVMKSLFVIIEHKKINVFCEAYNIYFSNIVQSTTIHTHTYIHIY